jgi:hypothetical protein
MLSERPNGETKSHGSTLKRAQPSRQLPNALHRGLGPSWSPGPPQPRDQPPFSRLGACRSQRQAEGRQRDQAVAGGELHGVAFPGGRAGGGLVTPSARATPTPTREAPEALRLTVVGGPDKGPKFPRGDTPEPATSAWCRRASFQGSLTLTLLQQKNI